jgi:hypothetical protein
MHLSTQQVTEQWLGSMELLRVQDWDTLSIQLEILLSGGEHWRE